jgi:hypothetical protein
MKNNINRKIQVNTVSSFLEFLKLYLKAEGVTSGVEYLPSKHEVLSSDLFFN